MKSKGKRRTKTRDWEQRSSSAGKASLITGQVHLSQTPDLAAHVSVAPTFAQTPERLQDEMKSSRFKTVRSGSSKSSLAEAYCCG